MGFFGSIGNGFSSARFLFRRVKSYDSRKRIALDNVANRIMKSYYAINKCHEIERREFEAVYKEIQETTQLGNEIQKEIANEHLMERKASDAANHDMEIAKLAQMQMQIIMDMERKNNQLLSIASEQNHLLGQQRYWIMETDKLTRIIIMDMQRVVQIYRQLANVDVKDSVNQIMEIDGLLKRIDDNLSKKQEIAIKREHLIAQETSLREKSENIEKEKEKERKTEEDIEKKTIKEEKIEKRAENKTESFALR